MAEKAAAVKSGEVKAAAAKTAAARTTAAKTAAAKSAAARSAAARTATKTAAAKAAAAKTTAAKSAAAKSAAAKAAAAKAAEAKAAEADAAGSGPATDADEPAQPTTETSAATAPAAPVRTPAAKRPAPKKTARTTKPRATSAATRPKPVVAADAAAPTAETVASPEPAAPRPAEDAGAEDVLFADLLSSEPAHADAAAESADATPSVTEPAVAESTSPESPVVEPEVVEPEDVVPEDVEPEVVEPEDAVPEDATPAAVADTLAGPASAEHAVILRDLVKDFGDQRAVNGIDLTVPAGSFYGIVGPNGAGKTTTLSILAGLLRATSGQVIVCGIDQAEDSLGAKRLMGVLPDRLRTFDRLTGRQLLHYYGLLRGLASDVIDKRTADLARAFDLADALNRVVSDYSAGMTKKIMLAGAMIHSPRVLVLDEPFEAVDPVSSAVILDILRAYVAHGGTVILSSHGMDLVERVCSRVAIIVGGDVLAEGTIDEVRAGSTLEARFVELSGGISEVEGLEWLHTFSD